MKIYAGKLSWGTTGDDLREAFEAFGEVIEANVIIDRQSDRSKGFGFVEMGNDEEAQAAIDALNGTELDGRTIVVNEARPREEKSRWGGNR